MRAMHHLCKHSTQDPIHYMYAYVNKDHVYWGMLGSVCEMTVKIARVQLLLGWFHKVGLLKACSLPGSWGL